MGNLAVHFSSERDDWPTPQEFFDRLNEEFRFTLDPAASHDNHKCERYFTVEDDGLKKAWENERVFLNPPYGRGVIDKWVEKSYRESRLRNALVVALLPARTDNAWWHNYVMLADEVRLVKGRIKFEGAVSGAPFPSCVAIWLPQVQLYHPGHWAQFISMEAREE